MPPSPSQIFDLDVVGLYTRLIELFVRSRPDEASAGEAVTTAYKSTASSQSQ